MTFKIVNLVATTDLGQQVDLAILSELKHVQFDHEIYGGRVAYIKVPGMHGKVSVFFSGKLISVGSCSEDAAQHALTLTRAILVENGLIDHVDVEVIVRNIVATTASEHVVDLEALSYEASALYEPEQFPAVIYKILEPKTTFLIFNSGKIVISGAKSVEHLEKAEKIVMDFVSSYT